MGGFVVASGAALRKSMRMDWRPGGTGARRTVALLLQAQHGCCLLRVCHKLNNAL